MTDDELLKLAGKAAGLNWGGDDFYDKFGPISDWNPFRFSSDALGLVAILNLSVQVNDVSAWAYLDSENTVDDAPAKILVMFADTDGDRRKALRRAITLAAAEIGRRMK